MRRINKLLAVLTLVALCWASYISLGWAAAPEGNYKNYYSEKWFATYALKEFDKVAPPPGVNWYVSVPQDWLSRATREGWIVKKNPTECMVGALVLGYDNDSAWVGIAREVTEKGLLYETSVNNKVVKIWIDFPKLETGILFKGYIWPVRPATATPTVNWRDDYKGVKGYTGFAWPLREFDKVAVKPGFNWTGSEKNWADAAAAHSWVVKTKPGDAKVGALMLFGRAAEATVRVGVVREALTDIVVFDYVDTVFGNIITYRLAADQMNDVKEFDGFVLKAYIWPEMVVKR